MQVSQLQWISESPHTIQGLNSQDKNFRDRRLMVTYTGLGNLVHNESHSSNQDCLLILLVLIILNVRNKQTK